MLTFIDKLRFWYKLFISDCQHDWFLMQTMYVPEGRYIVRCSKCKERWMDSDATLSDARVVYHFLKKWNRKVEGK
jgi:hypothetical protein